MKNKMIYAALVFALASCSSEQVVTPTILKGDVNLALSGNVTVTKADPNLAKDTQVGVYAWQTSATATDVTTTTLANTLYTVDAVGAFGATTPIKLSKNQTYKACAYAPFKVAVTDATAAAFAHGEDVIYAPEADVVFNTTATPVTAKVTLPFVHKMAQVKLLIVSGTGNPSLDKVTVKITGFYDTCGLNLSSGDVTASATKNAVVNQTQSLTAPLSALVPFCVVPGAVKLNIELVAGDVTYKLVGYDDNFKAGESKQLKLTLNVSSTPLEVTGTLVDWQTVTAASVDVPSI